MERARRISIQLDHVLTLHEHVLTFSILGHVRLWFCSVVTAVQVGGCKRGRRIAARSTHVSRSLARQQALPQFEGQRRDLRVVCPAEHLDCFISHTWKTSRWKKHMALSLQFNFVGAYALAFLVGVFIVVLGALQLLPVVETVASDRVAEPRAPCGMLAISVVFHVALNGACSPLLRFHRSLAFVDKTCIHQTDEAVQQRGTENLSMFIFFSWDFVVLYTKSYLQRLWTVYELASQLILQPQGRIVMLDLDAAPTVFLASAVWMISQCGGFVFKMKSLQGSHPPVVDRRRGFVPWLAAFIPFLLTTHLLRRRAKAHSRSIDELVQKFSLRSAACVREADRAPVERNVVEMLKSQGRLARDGGREEGMDMFDQLVRERLPHAVHVRYHYRDALAVAIVPLGEAFDSAASGLHARESLRVMAHRVCYWIFWHALIAPLLLLLVSTLTKQRLTPDGFCDGVYTLCVFVALVCATTGFERCCLLLAPVLGHQRHIPVRLRAGHCGLFGGRVLADGAAVDVVEEGSEIFHNEGGLNDDRFEATSHLRSGPSQRRQQFDVKFIIPGRACRVLIFQRLCI